MKKFNLKGNFTVIKDDCKNSIFHLESFFWIFLFPILILFFMIYSLGPLLNGDVLKEVNYSTIGGENYIEEETGIQELEYDSLEEARYESSKNFSVGIIENHKNITPGLIKGFNFSDLYAANAARNVYEFSKYDFKKSEISLSGVELNDFSEYNLYLVGISILVMSIGLNFRFGIFTNNLKRRNVRYVLSGISSLGRLIMNFILNLLINFIVFKILFLIAPKILDVEYLNYDPVTLNKYILVLSVLIILIYGSVGLLLKGNKNMYLTIFPITQLFFLIGGLYFIPGTVGAMPTVNKFNPFFILSDGLNGILVNHKYFYELENMNFIYIYILCAFLFFIFMYLLQVKKRNIRGR